MRKRIVLISMAALVMAAVAACSGSPDPVAVDLKQYAETMVPLLETETAAWDAYNNVTGKNYKNDPMLKHALQKDVIPKTKQFLDTLEMIRPRTNAVSGLNQLYIMRATSSLEGFELLLTALNRRDVSLVDEANNKTQQSGLYYLKWEKKLKELKGEE
jgi:hypothetical protein